MKRIQQYWYEYRTFEFNTKNKYITEDQYTVLLKLSD